MKLTIAVLLVLNGEKNGSLQGRTLLQKKLYFLSVLMDEDFKYRPHYYGPYSDAVADVVDELVGSGFLVEKTESYPAPNIFGEVKRYSYSLTDDGRTIIESVKDDKDFKKWNKALRKLNTFDMSQDFNLLSLAAKTFFIVSEKEGASAKEIHDTGKLLGWKISEEDINKVTGDLKGLGLIK